MVHFTCDLCGKDLTAAGESRFVVQIAAFPGSDADRITEEDLDLDNLEAIADVLRDVEDDPEAAEAATYRGFRYDLCPSCHRRFLEDPIGRDAARGLDLSHFSKN